MLRVRFGSRSLPLMPTIHRRLLKLQAVRGSRYSPESDSCTGAAALRRCGARPSAQPRSDPGNPARNIGAKSRIRSPECPLQRGFLVQHNVKVGRGPEQRAVCDETPIAEQKSLASNDNNDGDVDRISNVTV